MVSIEIIRPSLRESRNTPDTTEVLAQVPGVTILDGEPKLRIRGFEIAIG